MSGDDAVPPLDVLPHSFLIRSSSPSEPDKSPGGEIMDPTHLTPLLRTRFQSVPSARQNSYLRTLDTDLEPMVEPALLFAFRRQRNALSTWCRLPPEILCLVFGALKDISSWPAVTWVAEGEACDTACVDLGWIAVSQVCAYWREIALQAPWLWSDPENCFAISPRMASPILKRSQKFPLHLGFIGDDHLAAADADDFLSSWFSPSTYPRLRSLSICHVSSETLDVIEPYVRTAMDGLRSLNVIIKPEESGDGHPPCLPLELCLNPSLLELDLADCTPYSWDLPVFCPQITRLALAFSPGVCRELMPSPSQFAQILLSLPLLEDLVLKDAFPTATSSHGYPPIALPAALKSLEVRATAPAMLYDECSFFLGNIVVLHDIRLKAELYDHSGSSIIKLAPKVVWRIYQRQSPPKELVVGLQSFLSHNSECYIPDRPISTNYDMFQDVPAVTSLLSFALETTHGDPASLIALTLLSFPLRAVRAISFDPDGALGVKSGCVWWHELCVRARDVHRVGFYIESCITLLDALSESKKHGGVVSFTMFHQLEVIHIHAEDRDSIRSDDGGNEEQGCKAALKALRTVVRKRTYYGSPLRELLVDENIRGWSIWNDITPFILVKYINFHDTLPCRP